MIKKNPEVWKTREFDDIQLQHCNAVYNQNTIDRWTKGCILPFSDKGDLGITKNYLGITLKSIAAKIDNALQRNCIEHKIEKILRKNQKSNNDITNFNYPSNSRRCTCKRSGDNNIICRLLQSL